MQILRRTSLSSRLPYRRRCCQNCNGHIEGFCRESSTNNSTRQSPKNKKALNELDLIQFPDEDKTCQTPTLEGTNAENLVKGCNQCLHVTEIPHSSFNIQSPKPNSPRTQP
ncbi:unnamed protein product [Hymenolepis diminuta]|uniref:Uncharacterized protein n=1 Tax=Hymenolepis diminuta TaxID=6216 RepID=A0A564Z6X4_HYMDI|nr:unnamed protein product [Hymenolepis diminuta]